MEKENLFCERIGKMIDVFGENAVMASCFMIASRFRDIISQVTGSFPILSLSGPHGSGKTELGRSLVSFSPVRVHRDPFWFPCGTVRDLADYISDVPNGVVLIDEYKGDIGTGKIEYLKGTYSGIGMGRINLAQSGKRETTRVDCGIVLIGQKLPTSDLCLYSRVISLKFNGKCYTGVETMKFQELKRLEKNELHSIENSLHINREKVEAGFQQSFERVTIDLQKNLEKHSVGKCTLRNWAIPVAAFLCLENELHLPFTYQDVLRIAANGMIEQEAKTQLYNKLFEFWVAIENLVRSSKMRIGVDYHVRHLGGKSVITAAKSQAALKPDKAYLQISFSRIARLYLENGRQTEEWLIPKDSLKYYLEHSAEYRGRMLAVRFKAIDSTSGTEETKRIVTTAMVFDYDMIQRNYDININISFGWN